MIESYIKICETMLQVYFKLFLISRKKSLLSIKLEISLSVNIYTGTNTLTNVHKSL